MSPSPSVERARGEQKLGRGGRRGREDGDDLEFGLACRVGRESARRRWLGPTGGCVGEEARSGDACRICSRVVVARAGWGGDG
jgi:hypothetical protein